MMKKHRNNKKAKLGFFGLIVIMIFSFMSIYYYMNNPDVIHDSSSPTVIPVPLDAPSPPDELRQT
jgi:hypothetical protein